LQEYKSFGSAPGAASRLLGDSSPSRVVSWRYLPRRWLLWLVQPDVEEVVQVPAAVTLGEGDELGRGHIPVAVLGCPVTQDAEEHRVADLLAQGLQRHGPPVIDRPVKQVDRRPRVAG